MNYFSPKKTILPEAQKSLWSKLGFANGSTRLCVGVYQVPSRQ